MSTYLSTLSIFRRCLLLGVRLSYLRYRISRGRYWSASAR